ncbi:hypothetical protein PR001_g6835 [Phytophthora rubi]|uniref:Uncharacterized protein n=2 Tax=Phytophthora rubi TaxID=129364 RepID=A0A6A3N6E1_9STRA|nr:hypothetical protein PR002_g7258 [Phytophthora rubi]KAE9040944.1 hypothetical protein PR001_g6835 [Phytophthora rubi]
MRVASTSLLTTHGMRQLSLDRGDSTAGLRLQGLGVYRYLTDPALKGRLGQPFVTARDVGDDRHKVKVTKFKVFSVDPEDDKQKQRVVALQQVAVTPHHDDGVFDKVFARCYGVRRR